jgi:hypothetical protein
MTTCHDFEARLEALDTLPADERAACLRHAAGCPECSELLELARMGMLAEEEEAGAPVESLVGAVMASTSGPACDRALERLAACTDAGADGAPADPLVALHLETCPGCRSLAGAMAALAVDLPRLAEVRPDSGFADQVLRRTLPATVRLRRWWRSTAGPAFLGTWERLARRPRFAWEAAFVVTVAFLPLIVASGPTLAAAPARGAEEVARLAKEARGVDLELTLEARLGSTVRGIQESEAARRTGAFVQDLADALSHGAGEAADGLAAGYGTLRDLAASFLTKEGEDGSSPATNPIETQDSAPAPRAPASEETTK